VKPLYLLESGKRDILNQLKTLESVKILVSTTLTIFNKKGRKRKNR